MLPRCVSSSLYASVLSSLLYALLCCGCLSDIQLVLDSLASIALPIATGSTGPPTPQSINEREAYLDRIRSLLLVVRHFAFPPFERSHTVDTDSVCFQCASSAHCCLGHSSYLQARFRLSQRLLNSDDLPYPFKYFSKTVVLDQLPLSANCGRLMAAWLIFDEF